MGNSAQVAPLLATREDRSWFRRSWFGIPWWQCGVLFSLIAWLYASILFRLVLQWVGPARDPNFEHGIFVPLFAAFVLWQDPKRLQSIAPAPNWAGVPLIVVAVLMLDLGVLGAELFFSRISLLILLAGLIILFLGWPFFRAVFFPWAFLFLMIPIPSLIISQVTFPLQLLASKLAAGLLELVGVPVLLQGNQIAIPRMVLDVVEACSGIRSLLTLITLSIIYGYLMESRIWVRVALACSAVPIAVAANSFRIFGTGMLVQYWDPDKAEGFFHTFEGWLIFVAALIMLFAVHRLICLIWKSKPAAPAPDAQATRPTRVVGTTSSPLRFAIAAAIMLVNATALQARPHDEFIPTPPPLSSLPSHVDNWIGTDEPIDQQTLDVLGPGEFLLRDYEIQSQAEPFINLYIAYFPSQRSGDTIHSPSHCIPGAGWIPTSRELVELQRPDGSSFPANRYVIAKRGDRQLVLYWFQAHGRAVASEYAAKYYLIADSIKMNRSDGALVRLMSPMLEGESADAAQSRVMNLGSHFLPLLDTYIPR